MLQEKTQKTQESQQNQSFNPAGGGAPSGSEGQIRDYARRLGLDLRSFNECVARGAAMPDPTDLFMGLWYEGELTALYADTNVGKSILAVQMANEVAKKGFKVLYVDLELSDKGVEKRSRRDDGSIFRFSENFYRMTVNFSQIMESAESVDDEGIGMLDRIEMVMRAHDTRVLIIDNLTALCSTLETGESAVRLVNRLLRIRDDNRASVLFLAHTPKLDKSLPITRDSMAGSKRLISLIDSAFAIGECVRSPQLRYIKQTKVRLDECRYHENNVLVCRIERVDGLLNFVAVGNAREADLLRGGADRKSKKAQEAEAVATLAAGGLSERQIAAQMGLSRNRVHYLMECCRTDSAEGGES